MHTKGKVFYCNMELALDVIGGKWKPILLFHIGTKTNIRYGELKRMTPTISERVLTRALKELESSKLIYREAFEEKVLRVEYSLTEMGQEILPLLTALTTWGNKYNEKYNYAQIMLE